MKELIKEYRKSCELLRRRIGELNDSLKELRKNGGEDKIAELNLEQRIALLYTEHRQTQEISEYLSSYVRRVEQRVKKNNIL